MRNQMIQQHLQQTICSPFLRLLPVVVTLLRSRLTWKQLRNKSRPILRMMKTWKYWHFQIVYPETMEHRLLLSRTMRKLKMKSKHSLNWNNFRIMMQLLLLQVSLHPKIFNKKFSRWEAVLIWMQNNKLIWLKLVHLRSKNNNPSVEIKHLRLICKVYNFYSFFRKICKELSSNNLRHKLNK